MSASAPAHPALQLDRLPNAYPVLLLTRNGVAHDVVESGDYTRCGKPADRGTWLTLIQIHVWLNHTFCFDCFTGSS